MSEVTWRNTEIGSYLSILRTLLGTAENSFHPNPPTEPGFVWIKMSTGQFERVEVFSVEQEQEMYNDLKTVVEILSKYKRKRVKR